MTRLTGYLTERRLRKSYFGIQECLGRKNAGFELSSISRSHNSRRGAQRFVEGCFKVSAVSFRLQRLSTDRGDVLITFARQYVDMISSGIRQQSQHMSALVDVREALLKPQGHGVMGCRQHITTMEEYRHATT